MQNLQNDLKQQKQNSRWWFQICFMFIPNYLGKIPILTIIFLNGLKSPTRLFLRWTASVCWAIYKAVYDICPEAQPARDNRKSCRENFAGKSTGVPLDMVVNQLNTPNLE